MEAGNPHVLAAMDGREIGPADKPPVPNPNNQEPTAFFFIVFGLVYEALSTSSEDSTGGSQRQSTVIPALRALKCLVRPEYAGRAILEPTIFDEFTSLSYRLAMTEPADVQVHLVEMLSAFASAQQGAPSVSDLPAYKRFADSFLSADDALSLTSPRAHCLRICSHILKNSSSSSSRSTIISASLLITTAYTNLPHTLFRGIYTRQDCLGQCRRYCFQCGSSCCDKLSTGRYSRGSVPPVLRCGLLSCKSANTRLIPL